MNLQTRQCPHCQVSLNEICICDNNCGTNMCLSCNYEYYSENGIIRLYHNPLCGILDDHAAVNNDRNGIISVNNVIGDE